MCQVNVERSNPDRFNKRIGVLRLHVNFVPVDGLQLEANFISLDGFRLQVSPFLFTASNYFEFLAAYGCKSILSPWTACGFKSIFSLQTTYGAKSIFLAIDGNVFDLLAFHEDFFNVL